MTNNAASAEAMLRCQHLIGWDGQGSSVVGVAWPAGEGDDLPNVVEACMRHTRKCRSEEGRE
jgi:hypothetical protein